MIMSPLSSSQDYFNLTLTQLWDSSFLVKFKGRKIKSL